MINPMRYGSPDYQSSAAPYSPSRSTYHDTPRHSVPFQDRPGPTYPPSVHCKECNASLTDTWKFCPVCGTVPEKPATLESLKPKRCTCGMAIQSNFKFCPECAKPIDERWKSKPACSCGVIYAENAKHCIGCGKKVR